MFQVDIHVSKLKYLDLPTAWKLSKGPIRSQYQQIILVLAIGGRDYKPPRRQYIYINMCIFMCTWFLSGICCQLGDYMLPSPLHNNLKYLLTICFQLPKNNSVFFFNSGELPVNRAHVFWPLFGQKIACGLLGFSLQHGSFCRTTGVSTTEPNPASPIVYSFHK